MATELIINASLPETRIALTEDGEIQELLIERSSEKGIAGNIYKGRVTRVLPGMQAAFVDIGLEKAAFLYVDDVYVAPPRSEEEEPQEREDQEEDQQNSGYSADAPEGGLVDEAMGEEEGASLGDEEGQDLADALDDDSEPEDSEDGSPVAMGPEGGGSQDHPAGGEEGGSAPEGTVAPESPDEGGTAGVSDGSVAAAGPDGQRAIGERKRRRGRRGGRGRRNREERGGGQGREPNGGQDGQGQESHRQESHRVVGAVSPSDEDPQLERQPGKFQDQVQDAGDLESDRSSLALQAEGGSKDGNPLTQRIGSSRQKSREAFRQSRSRDRRIAPKNSGQGNRPVSISDLLKEGQEVLVQVSKDPIATKGARLTCHISLPGRHLVCMPTIDHVGVSRRIERDDERRKLREFVERNRPKKLGFIVRTASGRNQAEKRIKQDIDYLSSIWEEIRAKAETSPAPSMVYEDLNPVLRSIRDWVNEDIDKVIVDSRYHFNDITRFVSHFMPAIQSKIDLYHGDIPIFDAYGISSELSRALERKVWLKSGGYIVIDQAEALVAIDVNTGRFVGKKNLEDTILKTNLEAVQEIAYQLRLRNCGGIIILDLIDMEKEENKRRVYMALEDALKKDRARPTILKISELGLVEMTRKRTRDTMVRTLCQSCAHCEGKGFIKNRATVAYEVLRQVEREGINREAERILIQAHSDVIDFLAIEERESVDQLERRYRKQIYLQAVTDYHPEQFDVGVDKDVKAERLIAQTTERQGGGRERDRDRDRGRGGRGRDRDRGRERGDRERNRDRDQGQGRNQRTQPQNEGKPGVVAPAIATLPAEAADGESRRPVIIPVPRPVVSQVAVEGGAYAYAAEAASPGNGNGAESPMAAVEPGGPVADLPVADLEDEDRLAFLRAQAAQDAALARLGSNAQQSLNGGYRGGGGSGGARGFSGGGRGGKRRGGGRGGRGGSRHHPSGDGNGNY